MQTETEKLAAEIEAVALRLGIAPSTVGEKAGQGGKFYQRLKAGKRAWPETISAVRERLRVLQVGDPSEPCEDLHGNAPLSSQGDSAA